MAARKRSPDQLMSDRKRISELMLQHYTDREIAQILAEETGIELQRRQINYDRNVIRKDWQKSQIENYEYLVVQELERIDALEKSIWVALRESSGEAVKKEILSKRRKLEEAVMGEDDDGYELVVQQVRENFEDLAVNPAYFGQIHECQKERRRLLGLYAPQMQQIQKVVEVKGYVGVSPDDWPDVIEGEVIK